LTQVDDETVSDYHIFVSGFRVRGILCGFEKERKVIETNEELVQIAQHLQAPTLQILRMAMTAFANTNTSHCDRLSRGSFHSICGKASK
jgi:hypothetical protein